MALRMRLRRKYGATAPVGHGYTVTHYAAPYAQVSGASSDNDAQDATAYSNATSASAPCTAACALANAVAGHVVEFAPGVYLRPGTVDSESPSFKPLNSGTAGSPIIFTAKYPAAYNTGNTALFTEFGQTNDANKGTSPTLGAGGNAGVWLSHFIFDGIYLDQLGNAPITTRGTVRCYSPANTNTNHQYRRLLMDLHHAASGDNWDGIQIQGPSGVKVFDCLFRGTSESGLSDNAAVVTTYGAPSFEIAYNTFQNCNCTLFLKGTNSGQGNYGDFHHNKVIGSTHSLITISETYATTGQTNVYQNLAYDFNAVGAFAGIDYNLEAGSANLQNCAVYNNTVVYALSGALGVGLFGVEAVNGTNCTSRDNIYAYMSNTQSQCVVNAEGAGATQTSRMTVNYNRYYNNGAAGVYAYNGSGATLSFAQYKTNTGWDANSSEGDPQFENAATDDYRLATGSPCLTMSSTSGPVGCYITGSEEIGLRASPTY